MKSLQGHTHQQITCTRSALPENLQASLSIFLGLSRSLSQFPAQVPLLQPTNSPPYPLVRLARWSQTVDARLYSKPTCSENKGQNRSLGLDQPEHGPD